jgi:hypothetical protein
MDVAHIEPIEQLAAAVHANDTWQVQQVLEQHPELRSRLDEPLPGGAFGATALLAAVNRRNRDMIDVLLGAGAGINARSHWWAGSFGVLDGDTELAPFLIDRGATVDVHAAARLGMLARIEALVSADPSLVHARGGDGQTPLHFASSIDIARYLLDHGADINARDVDHESTPAQYMVRDRQARAVSRRSRRAHRYPAGFRPWRSRSGARSPGRRPECHAHDRLGGILSKAGSPQRWIHLHLDACRKQDRASRRS